MSDYLQDLAARAIGPPANAIQPRLRSRFEDSMLPVDRAAAPSTEPARWGDEEVEIDAPRTPQPHRRHTPTAPVAVQPSQTSEEIATPREARRPNVAEPGPILRQLESRAVEKRTEAVDTLVERHVSRRSEVVEEIERIERLQISAAPLSNISAPLPPLATTEAQPAQRHETAPITHPKSTATDRPQATPAPIPTAAPAREHARPMAPIHPSIEQRVIHVTIGRVEVTASAAPAPRKETPPQPAPAPLRLNDYLKQRDSRT